MNKFRRLTNSLRIMIVFQMVLSLIVPLGASAQEMGDIQPDAAFGIDHQTDYPEEFLWLEEQAAGSLNAISPTQEISPTLELDILGSPIVPYDFNDTTAPEVFIIHAQAVNTGTVTAENVSLNLDFDGDPGAGWTLLSGESQERIKTQLAPSEVFNGYWFAVYPLQVGETHQYTLTLSADHFDPISSVGTVEVVNALDTGNNLIERSGMEINVGVSTIITVSYDIGTNHNIASFNPVGNTDFLPGSYRLLKTSTDFFDGSQNLLDTFEDQLYYPVLKPEYASATTLYEFIALSPDNTTLCPYTMVTRDNNKYDNDFCTGSYVLPITGTITVDMDKIVSHETILQGETITYTLNYTNNGPLALKYAWVWDDIDPAFASVLTDTLVPAGDPVWTNEHRAAWYPNDIGAFGDTNPPYTGTVSFSAVVDGGGNDLADGDILVNHGKFGVTEGTLPETVALTATTYTTITAPTILATKTDDQEVVLPGTIYTYTLQVENVGSEVAENLVVTDTLPTYLSLAGTPQPGGYTIDGDQVIWDELGSLSAGDPPLEFKIPVELDIMAPDGHVITNMMQVGYANRVGHVYDPVVETDTTTVETVAAVIQGKAFQDDNLNGLLDDGEVGIENVEVTLLDATVPITYTDGLGDYAFRVETQKAISITAGLPADYFRTTAGTVFLTATLNVTDTVNFGYAPITSTLGAAYVTVFEDKNYNGIQDLGENGISGVELASTLALSSPLTTAGYGQATFYYDVSGTATITETDPAGYASTTPNVVDVAVAPGTGVQIFFGDFAGISMSGTVFDDLNKNGEQDPTEVGIPGVTVTLYDPVEDGSVEKTTDAWGGYAFLVDTPGTYVITETDPDGYLSTTPNEVHIEASLGGSYQVDFGDVLKGAEDFATIYGTVFRDADGDGVFDNDEVGIPGVLLTLDGGITATTDIHGGYTFSTTLTGMHTVVETDPDGYFSTTPNEVHLSVVLGEDYQVDFGDALKGVDQFASIHGTVFDDLNKNQTWDADEPGLSGVTVTLDGSVVAVTNLYGSYTFTTTATGSHTIVETDLETYVSTTPNTVVIENVLLGEYYLVNFGDSLKVITIYFPHIFSQSTSQDSAP